VTCVDLLNGIALGIVSAIATALAILAEPAVRQARAARRKIR